MFGLDDRIVALADGGSIWIVLAVAVLLGLRHATDPDHIAAVSTLVIIKVVDLILGIRVSAKDEEMGIDLATHGEVAYQT